MHEDCSIASGLTVLAADRERLVRLCAQLTGRADIAEDLAQETLVEAWRQRDKLERPEGQARWLAAIARNVCLRWRQRQARERHYLALDWHGGWDEHEPPADDVDLEGGIDRQELAGLLDGALALLPDVTRQVLLYHYVEDLPQGEIATRLGLREGTVAVRVHRGKRALRRVLNLRSEGGAQTWEATRLWCPLCAARRLEGRMAGNPTVLVLRCPGGCGGCNGVLTECRAPGPVAIGAYGRALSQIRRTVDRHYGLNRTEEAPRCSACGKRTPQRVGAPDGLPADLQTPGIHVFLKCDGCGWFTHSSLEGIALATPHGQRFNRRHPRMQARSTQEIEIDGLPAYAVRFESCTDTAGLDVLIRQRDFRLIAVHGVPDS